MTAPLLAVTVPLERSTPRQVAATVADAVVGRVTRPRAEVELAVHEAVANALLHGGPPIEVRADETHDAVEVEIVDGGGPPTGPRPAGEHGRGALLIAASCDQVEVDQLASGGRRVRLRFTRTPVAPARTGRISPPCGP